MIYVLMFFINYIFYLIGAHTAFYHLGVRYIMLTKVGWVFTNENRWVNSYIEPKAKCKLYATPFHMFWDKWNFPIEHKVVYSKIQVLPMEGMIK